MNDTTVFVITPNPTVAAQWIGIMKDCARLALIALPGTEDTRRATRQHLREWLKLTQDVERRIHQLIPVTIRAVARPTNLTRAQLKMSELTIGLTDIKAPF